MKIRSLVLLGALMPVLASSASAALVTFNTTTDFSSKNLFQANGTTSYTVATANGEVNIGNNTSLAADNVGIYATTAQSYTLAATGDSIVLSGRVTLTGIDSNSTDQIRIGLFNSNGSGTSTGWLGYFGSNDVLASGSGNFYERSNPNTGLYTSGTGAASIGTNNSATVNLPLSTSIEYSFTLSLTRTIGNGIDYSLDISEAANAANKLLAITGTDTTPQTFTYDRAGFLIGGNLDADLAAFRNVDVTFTPVPESSVALLGGLGVLGLLRRRRQ